MSLLTSWLESLSIDVKITNQCLRNVSPKSECESCIEACKTGSLFLTKGKVNTDHELCTKCGQCAPSCPVGAIVAPVPKREFVRGGLLYDDSPHPSVKELLVYRRNGISKIIISTPGNNKEWMEAIKKTNQILSSLNIEPYEIIPEESAKLSRRDFFLSAKKAGRNMAKDLSPAAWKIDQDSWKLSKYYLEEQFYEVVLDKENCNLCGACVSLCPTEAITTKESVFMIENQKCANCKLCNEVCYKKAISVTEKPDVKTTSSINYYEKDCPTCGHPFKSFKETEQQCFVCSNRNGDWFRP